MKTLRAFLCYALMCATVSATHTAATKSPIIIKNIEVTGNALVPAETILHLLPYRIGSIFEAEKSTKAIEALYAFGSFEQIILEKAAAENDENAITLYVTVREKQALTGIQFAGNKALTTKKLEELIDSKSIRTINPVGADLLARTIKKEYAESDYHEAQVIATVLPDAENPLKAALSFTIAEGPKSRLQHVDFIGNTVVPGRILRAHLKNKEAWLFGFLNSAGKYDAAALEMDKEIINAVYADRGHYLARVTETKTTKSDSNTGVNVVFTINEGPRFTIKDITIAPDEHVPHRTVRRLLTLAPGDTYKYSEIYEIVKNIKKIYGEYGYIDAFVSPQVTADLETNTVSITFHVDKGARWRLNRLTISGNQSTRDHVIRRQVVLEEGLPITSTAMDISKNNVQYLSYFDGEAIEWKKHRVDKDLLDLELHVKEIPTRQFNLGVDFGANQTDPNGGLKGFFSADLRNMFGRGLDSGFAIKGGKASLSEFSIHLSDPYLFNNFSAQLNLAYNKALYDQWKWVVPAPQEEVLSMVGRLGMRLPTADRRTSLHFESGVEHISNNGYDKKTGQSRFGIRNASAKEYPRLQTLVAQKFQAGTLQWLGVDLIKDTRNHTIYPNDGYRIALSNKVALPIINKTFMFIKSTLHASWYTPLIGFDTLVLGLHAYGGIVEQIGLGEEQQSRIPYRELFHMGGAGSLRGFNYSQAGPSWDYANPLGGKKALQFNAELIFPFLSNNNMKVHLFYDSACAWDTPKTAVIRENATHIKTDNFNLRHTIGIGLNILQPNPMKISFGYKLDRQKSYGETPSEFHIGVNSAF